MKENKYIDIIKSTLGDLSGYIGDDTAYIPEKDLILTQDTLIEDVHFRLSTISPFDLGIKSIAVNLSDIAASGGNAGFVLISLSLPKSIGECFVEEFYKGVNEICRKYGVIVAGGDLTGSQKVIVSVSVIGFGNGVIPLKRGNAKQGDYVVVTGNFGSSALGFHFLEKSIKDEKTEKFIKAHINPVPKLETGRKIAELAPGSALMDASDGLADALYKISLMSKVDIRIDGEKIPTHPDFKEITKKYGLNSNNLALFGGEDYELVGCISPDNYEKLKANNIPITIIGKVTSKSDRPSVYVTFEDKTILLNEETLEKQIFDHFN